jgi:hypothetical protein
MTDQKKPLTKEQRMRYRTWIEDPVTQEVFSELKARTFRQAMSAQSKPGASVDLKLESLMRMHVVDQLWTELERFLDYDARKTRKEDEKEGIDQ